MALIRGGALVEDRFTDVSGQTDLPGHGALIISLAQWQAEGPALQARHEPLGLRLKSHESPLEVRNALAHFAVIALEFPKFRDGRAYTHARLLRERLGYRGEIRAVGDVLQEQLGYMQRCGFDSFEISAADPLAAWQAVADDYSVWYQATGDGRPRAATLRHPAGH